MNISLTNKQALELVVYLKKENTFPLISRQIDSNFKEMEVSELLKLQDQFPPIFTVEFQIECVKCGKEFESIAVKKKTPPIKHFSKCPFCNTKHLWLAK
jgi:DNA-directed RNA polymerase subunit RPC12/RpoP